MALPVSDPATDPLLPRHDVDPRRGLPGLEQEILGRWRERDIFAASLRAREGAPSWVFYEGPPAANGPPGSHHVLSRVFKDIYPRFQTMRGYRVERKGGWDCHGLPVEIAVEKELGIQHKAEIEEYGIAEFDQECRESVFTFLEEWDRLTERIGFWLDLEHAYRTLDESYIESVWWALAEDRRGAACSTRATRWFRTAPAARPHSHRTRWRSDTATSSTRGVFLKLAVGRCGGGDSCWCGQRRPGPCPATWPSPSRRAPSTHACAFGGEGLPAGRGARGGRARRGRRDPRAPDGRRAPASATATASGPIFAAGDRGRAALPILRTAS